MEGNNMLLNEVDTEVMLPTLSKPKERSAMRARELDVVTIRFIRLFLAL
jgi:hypothetical protein